MNSANSDGGVVPRAGTMYRVVAHDQTEPVSHA